MKPNRAGVLVLATACLLSAGGVTLALRPRTEAGNPAGSANPSPSMSIAAPLSLSERIASDPDAEYANLFTRAAQVRLRRAHKRQGDAFVGYVNGIRIERKSRPRCSDFRSMRAREISKHQLPRPAKLPPLAAVWRQQGWSCGDKPYGVDRSFQMGGYPVYLTIARIYDQNFYSMYVGEERVGPGRIQGRPAVFIKPLTKDGLSNSWILFKDGEDLIIIKGLDLRFAHVRTAAESLPLKEP